VVYRIFDTTADNSLSAERMEVWDSPSSLLCKILDNLFGDDEVFWDYTREILWYGPDKCVIYHVSLLPYEAFKFLQHGKFKLEPLNASNTPNYLIRGIDALETQ
jgi:hypothetical protein